MRKRTNQIHICLNDDEYKTLQDKLKKSGLTISHFLPDVYVPCEVCHGKRYNRETLEVKYKDKNIADILDMTVEDALEFFGNLPRIARKLQTIVDVGLGYVKLEKGNSLTSYEIHTLTDAIANYIYEKKGYEKLTSKIDDIRDVFAMTNEAKIRGYKKGRFSFNVKGGRCEACRRLTQFHITKSYINNCLQLTCDSW